MKAGFDERDARFVRLADALGPDVVSRGALQYFFARPLAPRKRLTVRELRDAWAALAGSMRAGRTPDLLSLYVHIPFCPQKCRYCIYYSEGGARSRVVRAYLDRLHAEIEYLRPAFSGLKFATWYVGGGSPTLLTGRQLDDLISHLDSAFPRREGHQSAFECSPRTITAAKARVFARHGFNRVSFGVQSTRREVLKISGREYQTTAMVRNAFRILGRGPFWINADLLYGLAGDSVESAAGSFRAILREGPDQVTLYEVSPSTPSAVSREKRLTLAGLRRRLNPVLSAAGYDASVAPTCLNITRRGESRAHFSYDYSDMTAEPYSLLALGPTVRFYLYGSMRGAFTQYPLDAKFDPGLQCVLASPVSMDDEQRRFAVHAIEELGVFRRDSFEKLFGPIGGSAAGRAVLELAKNGRLKESGGGFAPVGADPRRRFIAALHLVDPGQIEAAEHSLRGGGAPGRPHDAAGPLAGRLRIAAAGVRLEVIVNDFAAGEACAHARGGFCYRLPGGGNGAPLSLGSRESAILNAFAAFFDEVVDTHRPASAGELVALLAGRSGALRAAPGGGGFAGFTVSCE